VHYYLIEALLVVSIIVVLYLVVKVFSRQKADDQMDLHQKIIKNQAILSREIHELKMLMKHHQTLIQDAHEQWKAELEAYEATAKIESKTKTGDSGQNLFLNDRYKEIFELQNKGQSVDEIAKQLGKGSGEISFILQLAEQART
jgi:DNA-binding NarL/FixJ family response regulator